MTARTTTPVEETITLLDGICTSQGLSYAIIGGIAATLYGSGRTTIDVDLVVQTEISSLNLVYDAFTLDFMPLKQDPLEFFQRYFVLPLIGISSRVKVDISAALSGFEHTALKRARRMAFGSASAMFCSPEDLILFKLVANRERDLIDVKDIVARIGHELDRSYLRKTAEQFREVERSDIPETLARLLP